MNEASFTGTEVTSDGSLQQTHYIYKRTSDGIQVMRNGKLEVDFKGEYLIANVLQPWLPYPLPQIIGHESVVAVPPGHPAFENADIAAVEINNSHISHNSPLAEECRFCKYCPTQCPARTTMGINVWPGALAPYLIVPVMNLIPIPRNSLSLDSATLLEPFAAALHGIDSSGIFKSNRKHVTVGILGANGKLGSLSTLALACRRRQKSKVCDVFTTAIVRDRARLNTASYGLLKCFGADEVVSVNSIDSDSFDVVVEATGSSQGMVNAIKLARNEVHAKSTHGQPVLGLRHWTEMVVAEVSLFACPSMASLPNALKIWETRKQTYDCSGTPFPNVVICPGVPELGKAIDAVMSTGRSPHFGYTIQELSLALSPTNATALSETLINTGSPFPRFDVAVVGRLTDADAIISPSVDHDCSILRPGGLIIIGDNDNLFEGSVATAEDRLVYQNELMKKSLVVSSSRCGDFRMALEALLMVEKEAAGIENAAIGNLLQQLVSHRFPLPKLQYALNLVKGIERDGDKKPMKIVICMDEKQMDRHWEYDT